MTEQEYLDKFGKIERPQSHRLEGETLKFEITNTREIRPSTFMEKLEKVGLVRLFPKIRS